ncbi:MAG: hypothetical protein B7X06_04150 [Verrucomicrobia bacterium 21-51-4]|nr:MAG: hypothetical protein B7X06_04150 [Verrucomicrobia bacterium 21-51-4]
MPKIPKELVIQVPGEAFFVQSLELPAELTSTELQEAAALGIEEASPFPMDQLAWGIYRPQGGAFTLVYATAKERIKSLSLASLEQASFVLPGFFG